MTIELEERPVDEAKERLESGAKKLEVRSWSPALNDGRWRAVENRTRRLKGDRAWFTEKVAEAILSSSTVGDQRDFFYGVRGRYGTKTIRIGKVNHPLKDEEVYDLFTGDIMENIQLLANAPMQSLGVRAGPRGFIFAQDGTAFVPRKDITYNLNGSPVLYFDLASSDTKFDSRTRKVIHFEKAAGFERLTSGNISNMLEAIFSTSQGQLSEAAHKFLAQREEEGRQIYSVHDSDPYGCFVGSVLVTPFAGDSRAIRILAVGEELITYLPKSGQPAKTKIVAKSERWVPAERVVCLTFERTRVCGKGIKMFDIICTTNHPFRSIERSWARADSLQIGEDVLDPYALINHSKIGSAGQFNAARLAEWRHDNPDRFHEICEAGYTPHFIDAHGRKPAMVVEEMARIVTNGARLVSRRPVTIAHLAHLVKAGEVKVVNGKRFIKVYNFECSPHPTYLANGVLVHNCQMMMLYGLASKNSAYMPSSYYAQNVRPLGLLPSIALKMELPPEDIAPAALRLAETNLMDMAEERPALRQDLEVFLDTKQQWEFQALNAIHEFAPQVYLVEALRVNEDEIKHVPSPEAIKKALVDYIKNSVNEFVDKQIDDYVFSWYYDKLKPLVSKKLKAALKGDVDAFLEEMENELPKLDELNAEDLREAVKLKLVENPNRYADDALGEVVDDVLSQTFDIEAKIEATVSVSTAKADTSLNIDEPKAPDAPLTKDNISEAIEKEIISDDDERAQVVEKIRDAVETRFGTPKLEW